MTDGPDGIYQGGECYRCGRRGHFARDPVGTARGKECSKCSQVGHFANVCKPKLTAEPLRRLTKKGEPFIFGREQQVAFADLKRRLTQSRHIGIL